MVRNGLQHLNWVYIVCQTQHMSAVQILQIMPSKYSAAILNRYLVSVWCVWCMCMCVVLEYFVKKKK